MQRLQARAQRLCTWLFLLLGTLAPEATLAATLGVQVPAGYPENVTPGTFTVEVQREAADPATCTVTGEVQAVSGSALIDVDFLAQPVSIDLTLLANDAAVSQQFTVGLIDDSEAEGDEQFDLTIQFESSDCALTVIQRTATATIVDDDVAGFDPGPDLSIDAVAGGTIDVPFTVTGSGGPFTLTARIGSVAPSTLPATGGDATFSFTIAPDTVTGTVIQAGVTITDASGISVVKNIDIQVVDPTRILAEIPGLTPNQRAMAGYLDTLCPRIADAGINSDEVRQLIGACDGLRDTGTSDAQAIGALDAINPEELVVAAVTTLRLTSMQSGNLMERLGALRSGASGIDLAGLSVQVGGQTIAGTTLGRIVDDILGGGASADDFSPWGLFANGNVRIGDKDATQNEAAFDYDTIGITAGADYRFRDNFVAGMALGYSSVDSDYKASNGRLDIEAWSASLFATYFVADRFYIDGMISYGSNDYDTVREISYTDGLGPIEEVAKGDTEGDQFSGGLSGGFDFNRGAWTFGPHAGAYYFDVDVDPFTESGAGGFNMVIGDQHARSFQLNAGGHMSVVYNTSWGVLIPHFRADWVHELEDDAELVNVRLANDPFATDPMDPIPPVQLQTDKPDSDYLSWSVGTSAQFVNGVSGFVNYRSLAGFDDFSMNEITWGLRFEKSF